MHYNRLMTARDDRPKYRVNSVQKHGDRTYMRAAALSLNTQYQRFRRHSPQRFLNHRPSNTKPTHRTPAFQTKSTDFQASWDLIPKQVLVMLANEDRNILDFRQRISDEKLKLEADFSNFTRELICVIDDLRTSLLAEMDRVYRGYVERYSLLKSEVSEFRRVKKEIELDRELGYPLTPRHHSNSRIVNEIEHDIEAHIKFKALDAAVKAQRESVIPLHKLTQELIAIGNTGKSYYCQQNLQKQLNAIKQHVSDWTRRLFEQTTEFVLKAEQVTANISPTIQTVPTADSVQCSIAKKIESPKSTYTSREFRFKANQSPAEARSYEVYWDNKKTQQPPAQANQTQPILYPPSFQYYGYQSRKSSTFSVSRTGRNLLVDSLQKVTIKHQNTITVDSKQSLLCCTIISNKYLCIGGRDNSIYVYTLDGVKVTVLHGHKAGICTMAQIKGKTYELLASGGDQGCGSVILWDLASWKLKTHFTPHSAAVSSIMDFNDYELLVSCSYDKTIKVINHVTNNVIMNIPNHTNSPIVAMSLNSHCNRLVSASLDCSLNVWKIKKMKEYGSLESISHERKLELGDVICQLVNIVHRNDIVICGMRCGKLNIVDIRTGQCKSIDSCSTPIIELVLIQSQNQPSHPFILQCTVEGKNIQLTETFNRMTTQIDVDNSVNLTFGCGVSPKMLFGEINKKPVLFLLSQSDLLREVRVYKVETMK